jgi:hypothetical protein
MTNRRLWIFHVVALALVVCGCGGATSTLVAKGQPKGKGPVELDVVNNTDVTINSLYFAETARVDRARAAGVAPGSDEDLSLWGEDVLGRSGLPAGDSFRADPMREGRYDVLAVDPDGREQLIKGLRLKAGGRYALQLEDGGWQLAR